MPLTLLHPNQLEGLGSVPVDRPIALLARHSIREQPSNGFASYDIPLTEQGRELAVAYGAALPMQIRAAYSSPVGRCVDTATLMLQGAGVLHDVQPAAQLVEPGCFVESVEKVAGLFFKLGPLGFANKHLRNELKGVLSPMDGVKKILDHIEATLAGEAGITLHITHDTILASFMYSLMGISAIDQDDWPWMMEGVYLWFEGGAVHWVWRGKTGSVAQY